MVSTPSSQQAHQLLGYVPDQPYLYDKLTGREFLRFVVEMYGLEPRRAAQRIDELIETFEMGDYVDELCENYSQGMKQRVVFASALVHDPKVLVVDEPLVGLDPRSARIVKDLFITQARSGCAVLMSTHLLAIAEELADRIGIVDHGRMLAMGTLEQLRGQVQHRGPLEDLFLKLTGDHRPRTNGVIASELAEIATMSLALPETNRFALPPIKADQTARALRHLRWCLTRNTVRSLLAGSRLRLSMILFCSVVFWVGLFGLFLGGFEFIGLSDELFHAIFEYLFSMFFLSISIMLFFSTGIITYTALFHSREGAFLLSTPATTDRIFAYKFAEAVAISSWGFFLLGSPLMAAYGLTVKAPAAFYAMFLIYLVMFVLIAGSLGAITAIVVANVFPKHQKVVLAAGRDHDAGPDRRSGGPALANARRHPDERLAGQRAKPAGVLPASALAQPLDVGRLARLGSGRLAALGLLPDGPLGTRGARLPGRGRRGARPLFPRLQPRPGGPKQPAPRRALRPRRRSFIGCSSSCPDRSAS